MTENEKYVLTVCDAIIDFVIDGVPFPNFIITQFMRGVTELKDRMENMEDDGK